ncbi:cysteine hydrolase [Acidisphaera sp. L21]|uniref:cysteine hydrolase n=1 Tax=Acidisphaera sp. L21 TaxID=1641851 RepID=UPI00131C4911|nr:cysteine hydrolase [Acidisphaera sp. L21]
MKTQHGLDVLTGLSDLCRPDRMALVVYDMQIGIVSQVADGATIIEKAAGVLAAARAADVRVIFTRHMSLPPKLTGHFGYRQAMAWQKVTDPNAVRPWFLRDSPGFGIVPELVPREDEVVLDKLGFSAFEGTPMATILRDCGLMAFAIVGIATEIGIEPTVRHGADLGLIPIVVQDACGAGHAEAGRRSVESMTFMGDAIMTSVTSIVDAFAAR